MWPLQSHIMCKHTFVSNTQGSNIPKCIQKAGQRSKSKDTSYDNNKDHSIMTRNEVVILHNMAKLSHHHDAYLLVPLELVAKTQKPIGNMLTILAKK